MLSSDERTYLENPTEFEKTRGMDYSKVLRSRIRKKSGKLIENLLLIFKHDSEGMDRGNKGPKGFRRREKRMLTD